MSNGGPIWPSGKSGPGQLKPAEEAFQMHKEVSAPGVKSSPGATPVKDARHLHKQVRPKPLLPQPRLNLSVKDILQQLANINVPVNDHNQELALLMAAHGIEISEDSFGLINKLLKGKNQKKPKKVLCYWYQKGWLMLPMMF